MFLCQGPKTVNFLNHNLHKSLFNAISYATNLDAFVVDTRS